jgi:hypothetical protein
MKTWRMLISEELKKQNETWTDVFSCTLLDSELDVEFDDNYGLVEGKAFTLWTHDRVYFPVQYDGAEWVGSVSRLPDGKATKHFGAGG